MKKLLLTLVGIVCSLGIWAEDVKTVDDLVAITGDYTLIADDVTNKGTVGIGKSVLFGDNHFLSDVQGLTVSTSKGKSTINEVEHLNSLRVKNNVMIAFKVSGACHVKVYHQSNSSRTIIINSEYKLSEGDVVGKYSSTTTEADIKGAQTVYVYSIDSSNLETTGKGDLYIAGIEITFAATSYNISYENDGNGTITGTSTAKAGSTVNITATPNAGYRFDYLTVNGTAQTAGATSFTMPNADATVKAFFAGAINATGVSLDKTTLGMMQYSQATLIPTVAPTDATNKNVTWTSDNETVATVNNGVVYAKSIGTANITVTTEDGNYTATCAVTVTAIPGELCFTATPLSGKEIEIVHLAAEPTEVTEDLATVSGGTMYLYNGHASTDAKMIYANQFNLASSGASYIKISLDNALKAGDVISLLDYYDNGVTKENAFYISTSTSKGSTSYAFPYVVTETSALNNVKDLYLWKNVENVFKTINIYSVSDSPATDEPKEPATPKPNAATETATIKSDGTADSDASPACITTSGGVKATTYDGKANGLKLESSSGLISLAIPSGASNISVELLSSATCTSLKLNGNTTTVTPVEGTLADGTTKKYTITLPIADNWAGTNYTIAKGSGSPVIYQIILKYSLGNPGITLTTTANMAGYRSFYDAAKSYTTDANTKVYVASEQNAEGQIVLTSIGSKVPAGTPVILVTEATAETDGTFKMVLTEADKVDYYGGKNLLMVTTAGQSVEAYRIGYKSEGGIGFYKYSTNNAAADIVYLEVSNQNSAKVSFVFNTDSNLVTGVNAIQSANDIKVRKAIVNGRLVIVTANGTFTPAGAAIK